MWEACTEIYLRLHSDGTSAWNKSISKWAETPYEISHASPKNPELEILTSKCILESRTPKSGRFKETDGVVH